MRPLLLLLLLVAVPVAAAPDPYAGLGGTDEATRPLDATISPPDGFSRVPVAEGSLGAWLRSLPVYEDRTEVRAYDGSPLRSPAARVVAMDVGRRDLQQCADSAIRLLSEYARASGQQRDLAWDFTSGDRTGYRDWLAGERFVIGRTVERRRGEARSDSRQTFRSWLDLVFTYAGTRSLAREGEAVEGALLAGDVFVAGGSPGHAVMILDVATNDDGRRVALLGQGFMPAQEFHVLRSRGGITPVLDGVWFELPGVGERIDTPSWAPFERSDARRLMSWE